MTDIPRRLPLLMLATLLLASACAAPQLGVSPSRGGYPWHQLESAHFRVRTDLDLPHARERVLELERFRAGILLGLAAPEPPGKLEVILFREFAELAGFNAGPVFGFLSRSELGALLVCAEETTPDDSWGRGSARAHELAHYLSFFSIVRQPRWLAEGLAGYFGTLNFDEATGRIGLGVPSRGMLGILYAAGRPLPLQSLWDWNGRSLDQMAPGEAALAYASSWIWFHTLLRLHPRELADFERRLSLAQEPRSAFASAFAASSADGLAGEVLQAMGTLPPPAMLPLPQVPTALEERPLTDAEFHLARARVLLAIPANIWLNRRRALAEVADALRSDRQNLEARLLELGLTVRPRERLALARALVADHPENGEAHLVLGTSLAELASVGAEREQAFQQALQLSPQSGKVLNDAAWEYAGLGQAARALPLAQRAVALEPWQPGRLDTYAFVLNALGRCADAVDQEQRALELLPEMATREQRDDFQARLTLYRSACAQQEPAARPPPPTAAGADDDGPGGLK